jgi:hypothetical protein
VKAAILGAGPAGLMAALAAERNGLEPVIFAKERVPSLVHDDMFLQRPLPDVEGLDPGQPDAVIDYVQRGTSEGYAEKCYGYPSAPVSWDHIRWGFGDAWWLKDIYETLWERYVGNVVEQELDPLSAALISQEHVITLSTVPATVICNGEHSFSSVPTWLVRSLNYHWDHQRSRNRMVYNGENVPGESWFRASWLRAWTTFEYAGEPPVEELGPNPAIIRGLKFTGNSCKCNPAIARVGRWAMWQRGVLNHHAYEQTIGFLASAGLGKVA